MGVPVVTFPGQTYASRHSFGHLKAVGLDDFIAPDRDGYIDVHAAMLPSHVLIGLVRESAGDHDDRRTFEALLERSAHRRGFLRKEAPGLRPGLRSATLVTRVLATARADGLWESQVNRP